MKTVTDFGRGLVVPTDEQIAIVKLSKATQEYKAICALVRTLVVQVASIADFAIKSAQTKIRAPIPEIEYVGQSFEPEYTLPTIDYLATKEIAKYEPKKYDELTLVNTKVIEKVGRKWRVRRYWRIAGEKIHGRYDYIRCDGRTYPAKKTYVPANFRRSTKLDKATKEREGKREAKSQIKRYRIATVPIAIRFIAAKKLKGRLESQAQHAFNQGNMRRYDTLDNRANAVGQWIAHVAAKYGNELAHKSPNPEPKTDKQRLKRDLQAMPKNYRVKSNVDWKLARKFRQERIARQQSWGVNLTSRKVATNGAHKTSK